MSKLIAFRMPDALVAPFDAWCAAENVSATSALVRLLWQQLGPDPAEVAAARADAEEFGAGFAKITPNGRMKRIAPDNIFVDARTGESLPPHAPYGSRLKKGKTK